MHHGLVGVERLPAVQRPAAPLAARPAGPALGVRDVVLLLPRPRLGAPPRAALVAAALDERQVRRVGDGGAADPEAAHVGVVAGPLVVVGEAFAARPDRAPATRDLDGLEARVAAGR